MSFSHDQHLNKIAEQVMASERLTFADGMALYATNDLPALGKLADTVRRRRHGTTTYFNVNRHFNPTNVCYVDCKFCGFYRTPRQPDAYTHNIHDSLQIASRAVAEYKFGTLIVKPAERFDLVREATKKAFQELGYFLVLDELKLPGRALLKARDPQDTSIEVKLESAGSYTKVKIRHGLRGQLAPEQRLYSAIERNLQ